MVDEQNAYTVFFILFFVYIFISNYLNFDW